MTVTTTAKTYDRQTATFLAAVGQNMPEMSVTLMQEWIEHPKDLQKALWKALWSFPMTAIITKNFSTWGTVTLGTHKSVENLSRELRGAGIRIEHCAGEILKEITLAAVQTDIDIVNVSVAELGFNKPTRHDAIYDRAKEFGLDLVPAEGGPQLRLQYTEQPMGQMALIAMEPISCSDGGPFVFSVIRSTGGPWLDAVLAGPDILWNMESRWVFAQRRK